MTGPETAAGVTAGSDDDDEGVTSAGIAPAPEAEPAEEVLSADEPAIGEKIDPEAPWQRLSWRMLLVYPLGMLTRLLPLFLISLWLGSNRSNYWFEIIVVSLVILSGVLRWLSTSYQVGRTHIILKKGFFSRQVVTVARQRIRSVDTESDLFHRVLKVSIVEVGTGRADSGKSDAERFRLDAIDTTLVDPLRDELLKHRRAMDPSLDVEDEEQWGSKYGEDIARWKVTWSRFAPFSFIGFGVLFSLWLITWQMGDMHDRIMDLAVVEGTIDWLDSLGQPWAFVGKGVAIWLVAGVLAIITYAIRYGKYALTDRGQLLYVQNGILRRKHIALDKARLRGVEMRLPVYLRMLGGGRLEPIMTGTKKGATASTLLPQAPIADVRRVAIRILGNETPVTVPLRRHPWKASRRRVTRGLLPFWIVAGIIVLVRIDSGPSADIWVHWGIPAALVFFVVLSVDRIRMLGHALLPEVLVTSNGSWTAKRSVLEADGIIGWTVTQSVFQRTARVATVSAATPAGNGVYSVVDIDADEAWALAEALTPGITDVWHHTGEPGGRVSPSMGVQRG
ncbi:putative membrane protein [Dietzia kunjamensis subsp. schimae]|uniref:Membrane protein n=1 Tax=Dietzia kunjamensis subsp. schimae TaxID=498198 RepID=A0ABY1MWN4_9ACTN|nr:PH domain-containing protein [Dietzia kunjamensis]MBB1015162.1 PH domain-containing protein [Dietzia kunjamensis subsp. schimae]SMO39245.1 putative membrane protein [Dietzia kunjamensis subsp. schimae]